MSIKTYENFKTIQEVRKAKKCPVLNFKPIRESETYTDMIGMGWIEVLADNPAGILAKATEEERNFKDRLGNIAFYHPSFKGMRLTSRASRNAEEGYPHFNIKHDGGVRVVEGLNLTAEFPRLTSDLKQKCMTVQDYLYKMGFLIKYTIRQQGFPVSDDELYNTESYKDMIRRKMKENPSVIKSIDLPPSLKSEDLGKGSSMLKRFGAFGKSDD